MVNDNSKNKKAKPIKNHIDFFINTSLNHMSIRSHLISKPKNNIISNREQLFNNTDLLPITFGVILPLNPRAKKSTNSQINPGTLDENKTF